MAEHKLFVARERFLAGANWASAERRPLPGDASKRRYVRLKRSDGRSAMLMETPPGAAEAADVFAAMTGALREGGFSAPDIYDGDLEHGFLLLEDLGDALFSRELAAGRGDENHLYGAAIDMLAALHAGAPPLEARIDGPLSARAPIPPYDLDAHRREARLYLDWWAPAVGAPVSEDMSAAYDAALAEALGAAAESRGALVLRDFHADNLIWLPERAGQARVGVLDYQDALLGHPAYDLMSLLEDARRDVPQDLAEQMIRRYLAAQSDTDAEAFRAAYAAMAAARNLKIVGIFARLWLRDGKPRYLDMIPRVSSHLQRDLAHPACDALRRVVADMAPGPSPETLRRVADTPPRTPPPPTPEPLPAAMVLAAGLGTRMRPLTDHRPKPLIEVRGRPLLDHALEMAKALGAERAVVNTHYLADQIERHLSDRDDLSFTISHEGPKLLETGGGVKQALPLLDADRFLTLNSDAVWSEPDALAPLRTFWDPAQMDALLLLVPRDAAAGHAGKGDFFIGDDGRIARRGAAEAAPFIYSGAQILAARAFDEAPEGAFSLNIVWDHLIAEGRAYGVVAPGRWVDVGSPAGLDAAEATLAGREETEGDG